jgi:hypothetical protein
MVRQADGGSGGGLHFELKNPHGFLGSKCVMFPYAVIFLMQNFKSRIVRLFGHIRAV